MYSSIKEGDNCEPYIRQCHNRHLRRILAQFRTGSHWLHIETGQHQKSDKNERTCPCCAHKCVDPGLPKQQLDSFDSNEEVADFVEDEHHEYTYALKQFTYLFNGSVVSIGHFFNQPDCNRVAKFLTHMNLA